MKVKALKTLALCLLIGSLPLGCSPKKVEEGLADSGVLTPPPPPPPPEAAAEDAIFHDGFEITPGTQRKLLIEDFECPAAAAEEIWSIVVAQDITTVITDSGEVQESTRQITAAEYCGLED